SPRQPSGKNIIRWLLKKRTNGSVRYCQYTSGFISIADWYAQHAVSPYSDEVRQAMLKAVALAFKKMHSINRQHGCCYVRHIYVKTEGNAEAGFLDLEKSRRRLRRDKAINHDFRQLEKYLEPIPKADWEQVKAYYYAM
uniref:lipopolysaccharide kinase InaA n=4 Tax=Escherichia coli TaxID=562 RepID=UPI001FCE6A63